MIGILAEKPSAMRDMAIAFGGKIGKFNGEAYTITNAAGHLYKYKEPELQVSSSLKDKYSVWSLDALPWNESDFKWVRDKKDGANGLLTQIKSDLSACDEIVIATDDDPSGEGSLIAWEIISELNLRPKKISRMFFEDLSVKQLQKAFINRKPLISMDKDPDYVKAIYRTKWDKLSMQFTRIASKCGDGKTTLKNGRLKSAMTLLVGDALTALNDYKKVPFYQNRFRDENGIMYTNADEPMFPKKDDVPSTYHSSAVIVDKVEQKTSAPPKLLDLAALSSRLSSQGIKAKEVLATYQNMYEAQIVSYPRTDDTCVTPDQFNDLLPFVDKIASLVGIDTKLLTHRTHRSTHVKGGCAHGANRPGLKVPNSLSDLSKHGSCAIQIYTILAKNYLSILGEDYEYESQKGHVKDYPSFVGMASVPKKLGYKAIFSDDEIDDMTNSKGLGSMADPFIHEGFPPKPPVPTMTWLMKQLERYDVGTGSTRTSTYAEMTESSPTALLSADAKGKLDLTICGNMNYRLLPGTHIGDLSVTERVLREMKEISEGKADADACLHEIQQMVIDDIATMKANSVAMRKDLNITMQEEKEKYSGKFNGKDVTFSRVYSGYRFTDEECETLCNGSEIRIDNLTSAKGSTYGISGKLGNQTGPSGNKYFGFGRTGFLSTGNAPTKEKYTGKFKKKDVTFTRTYGDYRFTDEECEKLCNGEEIEILGLVSSKGNTYGIVGKLGNQTGPSGNKYFGFGKTGYANSNSVPKQWCKHDFSDDEILALESGLSVHLDGCISKKGSIFSATVTYAKKDDGTMVIIPVFD